MKEYGTITQKVNALLQSIKAKAENAKKAKENKDAKTK